MNRRAKALHGIALLLAACLAQAEPFGYVVNSDSPESNQFSLVRVDLASGSHTFIGSTGYADVEGLAFAPDGTLYGVDDATKTLLTFNLSTGEATPVNNTNGNLGLPTGLENFRDFGLNFDFSGNLWLSSDATGELWQVDPETGALTTLVPASGNAVATADGDGSKNHATVHPHLTALASCGNQLFGVSVGGEQVLYRAPTGSGNFQAAGPLGANLTFDDGGMDFDSNGTLWGVADRSTYRPQGSQEPNVLNEPSIIFTIDPGTGAASRVATTVVGVEALAVAPPAPCLDDQSQAHRMPATSPTGLALMIIVLSVGGGLFLRTRPSA